MPAIEITTNELLDLLDTWILVVPAMGQVGRRRHSPGGGGGASTGPPSDDEDCRRSIAAFSETSAAVLYF
jgi:hypothetical protein